MADARVPGTGPSVEELGGRSKGSRERRTGAGHGHGGGGRGAGVTTEELGSSGAKFWQPFGVEFEGAKDLENLGEQRHIYSHGLTAAGNISCPPR